MADSLTKFGIPLGSAFGSPGRGGILMPKLKYRFRVRVLNFGPIQGGLDFTQQVMTAEKPKLTQEKIVIDSYVSRAFIHGKHTWDPITVVIRDDITNSVARLVGHQVQKQVNHFEQTSFAAGINYKFTTFIEILDGGNDIVLEEWTCEGCWLENITWSTLDYAASEIQDISMTISYDNATLADGLFEEVPQFLPGTRA